MVDQPTVAELIRRIDALESQQVIRGLKARYMQWCDDQPRADFSSLFWPDATWEGFGAAAAGPVVGAAAIAAMLGATPPRFTFSVHYLTNESIAVSGDVATGHWKLFEPCTIDDRLAIWQGGRYANMFERRDGEWRFSRMELHLEFRTPFEEGWLRTPVAKLPPR